MMKWLGKTYDLFVDQVPFLQEWLDNRDLSDQDTYQQTIVEMAKIKKIIIFLQIK